MKVAKFVPLLLAGALALSGCHAPKAKADSAVSVNGAFSLKSVASAKTAKSTEKKSEQKANAAVAQSGKAPTASEVKVSGQSTAANISVASTEVENEQVNHYDSEPDEYEGTETYTPSYSSSKSTETDSVRNEPSKPQPEPEPEPQNDPEPEPEQEQEKPYYYAKYIGDDTYLFSDRDEAIAWAENIMETGDPNDPEDFMEKNGYRGYAGVVDDEGAEIQWYR